MSNTSVLYGNPLNKEFLLVERYTVTGSPVTSHTFSGLNGNVDIRYKIVFTILGNASSGGNIFLQVNSDTSSSNYYSRRNYGNGNADVTTVGGMYMSYLESGTVIQSYGVAEISAITGMKRHSVTQNNRDISNQNYSAEFIVGSYSNTTNNITSMIFLSDQVNAFNVGSFIEL